MYRRNGNTQRITLEYIDSKLDAKFDKFEEKWARERKEEAARHAETMEKMELRLAADRRDSEQRLAADRKEAEARQQATEARLAADRKDSEARLAADRKDSESRFERAMQEFKIQRRWLIATFFALTIGFITIYLTISGQLPHIRIAFGG